MSRSAFLLLNSVMAAMLLLCACSGVRLSPDSEDTRVADGGYHPPPAEEWTLPNGLTVLFLRNPELPMVSGTLYIKGGALWEPRQKPGLLAATGNLMRQGGAGEVSADQLDRTLNQLSASISTSFGEELGIMNFSCLSSDVEQVLPLFSQVIQRPRFEQERLNLLRGMALEGIRRRRDDPGTIASTSFNQVLFAGTVYGQVIGERDVKNLARTDLIAAHREFVRPDGAYLVVSGDIARGDLERLVRDNFSSWQPRGAGMPPPPPIDTELEPAIYFVEMPFEQSTVIFGQRGVPRLTPDTLAIEGFNKIFGSLGFGSRLMNRIRSDLGLVYGISGSISPGVVQGENLVYLQTKAPSTGQAIVESLAILKSMQEGPILESEMKLMKDTSVNSFVFKFDTPGELVQRYALLRLLGYPADYDLRYIPGIKALTPEDIIEVARKRWQTESFVYVVTGNKTAYDSLLAAKEKEQSPLAGVRLIRAEFTDRLVIPGKGAQ